MENVYLDYAASTPVDPRVAQAVEEAMRKVGNPSSTHAFGRELRADIDRSREAVGLLFGVASAAVTFTSGATEANALALIGAWRNLRRLHPHRTLRILTSPLEHASVAETIAWLSADEGAIVDVVPVGASGIVNVDDLRLALTPDTVLVTLMWANNVLGTLQPIADVGRVVAEERVRRGSAGLPLLFHSDAVQAASTQRIAAAASGVDLLTVSSHKMYGPKGVGALIRPNGAALDPLVVGGGQEGGLRGGTENVAGIVGFGRAAEIMRSERETEVTRVQTLRASFFAALRETAPHFEVVGDAAQSVPGTVFLRSARATGDRLAMLLDAAGFAVSAGSACDSGKRRQSSTLTAVLGDQRGREGGVRVSFGRGTTEQELRGCAAALGKC